MTDNVVSPTNTARSFSGLDRATDAVVASEKVAWTSKGSFNRRLDRKGSLTRKGIEAIRKGIPDALKAQVWVAAAPPDEAVSQEEDPDIAAAYCEGLPDESNVFHPSAASGVARALSPAQQSAARRVLTSIRATLGLERGYCAILPVLACALWVQGWAVASAALLVLQALLLYMDEDVALGVMLRTLRRPGRSFWIPPGGRHRLLQEAARCVKLAIRLIPKTCKCLKKLGVDLYSWVVLWFSDGLASSFPLVGTLRIVGSYLAEGGKIFTRYILAALKLQQPALAAAPDKEAAESILSRIGFGVALDKITQAAFRFRFSYKKQPLDSFPAEQVDLPPRQWGPLPDCPSEIFKNRAGLWEDIWHSLPPLVQIEGRVAVAFDTSEHGVACRRLLSCADARRGLLVVETEFGDIVGCYIPVPVEDTDNRFCAGAMEMSEGFVFSSHESEPFYWTGRNENFFLSGNATGIVIGTDAALHLDVDLLRGATSASESFNSPRLCKADFLVKRVEFLTFE